MNCQKFEDVVSELARAQMMDADLRTEALAHVADCRPCTVRLDDEEQLSRGLGALRLEMDALEAPVEVESRLLAAFRSPAIVLPSIERKNNYSRYWLTAIAALLLIVFGVVFMRTRTENKQPPLTAHGPKDEVNFNATVAAAPQPEPTVSKASAPEKRAAPKRKPVNPVKFVAKNRTTQSTRNPNAVANHAVSEVATEFMPLGFLTQANFQEGGQIVRVELPRAALANFGLPVNMERYREKVKADILVGADGLAHAIRFVQ